MKSISFWLAAILVSILWEDVWSFAAKKKSGNKRNKHAASKKGFGAPPPTFEQVLETFKTRVPKGVKDISQLPCPCGSTKTYGDCCGPFHEGRALPQSPLDVLRSRYSAFCWRNIQYIIDTTHPTSRDYQNDRIAWAKELNKEGMFDSYDFISLETVGDEEILTNEGFLEFKVTLRAKEDKGSTLAGQEMVISEKSTFLRDEDTGKWLFASGEVRSEVEGLEDTILNQ